MTNGGATDIRVLLIYPSFDREEQYGDFADLVWKEIPLSLGFLAGYLRDKGVPVKIVDEQWGTLNEERIAQIVSDYQPHLVGLSTLTPVFYRALEVAGSSSKRTPTPRWSWGTYTPPSSLRNP
ncbi:MAG: hypothetical protein QF410_13340 [Planctomycetota bacterium]|jgi:hypothetical protein|nr:hypothetical protein [Planctomycetota bacterium]MDP6739980.1 hypothetical protein [Planctomycetota bacterium]MDP6940221.1 hypothetical protein [Planctomycetota bacterium]